MVHDKVNYCLPKLLQYRPMCLHGTYFGLRRVPAEVTWGQGTCYTLSLDRSRQPQTVYVDTSLKVWGYLEGRGT